ncbi:hypothetical protein BK665_11490 [Pseudomonas frederiksbergensis]|uniref:Uncharacterized protein n=1 Tax=Pseudomonas frederiksbergensis TaxID=104087 RepID=A0A423KM51_9PSED|nr:hypothetical protein BK665_11490 [Pseudomonas frederiksbergensis]
MPLEGHPQPVGAGPAGGSGASVGLLATDGATTAVLVVVPFGWRRITVVFSDEEGVESEALATAVGVEPVRPSKRIV